MLSSTIRSLRNQTVRKQKKNTNRNREIGATRKQLGWLGWCLLVVILGFAVWTRTARLGEADFYGDEYNHVRAATGFLKTGHFYKWNFLKGEPLHVVGKDPTEYLRSRLTTLQVAGSFQVLGTSETAARIPSVFWGGMTVLMVFLTTFTLTRSIAAATFTGLLITFHPEFIHWSRTVRMYSMLAFVFPVSILVFLRGLLLWKNQRRIHEKVKGMVWVISGMGLYAVSMHLHLISIAMFPGLVGVALLFGLKYSFGRRSWQRVIGVIGIVGSLAGITLLAVRGLMRYGEFRLRKTAAWEYWSFLSEGAPFAWILLALVAIGIGASVWQVLRKRTTSETSVLLAAAWIIPVAGIAGFAFATTRYVVARYVLHFLPLLMIVAGVGLDVLLKGIQKYVQGRVVRRMLTTMLLVLVTLSSIRFALPGIPSLFPFMGTARADLPVSKDRSSYRTGYQSFAKEADAEHRVLIRAPKEFYLDQANVRSEALTSLPSDSTVDMFILQIKDVRPTFVSWPDVPVQHLSREIRQCVRYFGEDISADGSFVSVYRLDKKARQRIIFSECKLSKVQRKKLKEQDVISPPRATLVGSQDQ